MSTISALANFPKPHPDQEAQLGVSKKSPTMIRPASRGYLVQWLAACLLIACLAAIPACASTKKGVGLADLHAPQRITALDIAWYYTWKPYAIEGAPPEKFVPMIWGGHRLDEQMKALKSRGKVPILLLINEPDKAGQANMPVDEVIARWPELSSLADRVSSPAAAGVLGSWFDRFYRAAKARALRVDFMAVHLYGPPDADRFLDKIDAVYRKYGLPIWITEFAVADWAAKDSPGANQYSEQQVLDFMRAVLPELEKRPYVERYAWFGAGKHSLTHEQVRTSRLFEADGTLTPLGRFYANFQ